MGERKPVLVEYRNHRGEVATRRIIPIGWWWGKTQWHPEEQWLIEAFDLDKQAGRTFAARDVLRWVWPEAPHE